LFSDVCLMSATQAGKKQHPARRAGCLYCVSDLRLQAVDVNRDKAVSVASCTSSNGCDPSSGALEAHFVCGGSLCKCKRSSCLHDWCRCRTIHTPRPSIDSVTRKGDGILCRNRTTIRWRQTEVVTAFSKALAICEGNVIHCGKLCGDGAKHDSRDAVTNKLCIQFHGFILPNRSNNITH